MVSGSEPLSDQEPGQLAHPFLVGPADHEHPTLVLEDLLEDHDLAGDLEASGQDHVQRLVQGDFLASFEAGGVNLGMDRDPHLATGGEDVHRAVVVGAEERPVGRRGHRELLDLLAQRRDVLAGLAEGRRKPLVLGDRLGELALGLQQALFEGPDPFRGVLEPASEDNDFLLQRLELRLELTHLALVLGEASLVLRRHVLPPPAGADQPGLARDTTREIPAHRGIAAPSIFSGLA